MVGSDEIWHVQLPSGEVRPVSLDELDAAFDAGHITASAHVLAPGTTEWTTLGAIAGLDDDPEPAQASPAAVAASPLNVASFATPQEPSLPPSLAPIAFDLPSAGAGSTFDLAGQLEGDDDLAFKPKRGKTIALVAGALAAVAAIGLALGLRGEGTELASSANSLSAANALEANVVAPAEAPAPPPAAAPAPSPGPSELTASAPRLSDEQRRLLLEADKAHAADIARVEAKTGTSRKAEKAHTKSKATHKKAAKKKRNAAGKKAGASGALDKYDPLNGSL